MTTTKTLTIAAVAAACLFALPTVSQARSSYGFSINTGPAYYPNYYAPRPYVYAPPPVPVRPYYYRPYYQPYYGGYYNTGPSFSFSYSGR